MPAPPPFVIFLASFHVLRSQYHPFYGDS